MVDPKYNKLKQEEQRDNNILKSMEVAASNGTIPAYSEEQQLSAQKQEPKRKLSDFHDRKVRPYTNAIVYVLYLAFTVFVIPYSQFSNSDNKVVIKVALIAYVLIFLTACIMHIVEKILQKDIESSCFVMKCLIEFSDLTSVIGYALTSLGYMIVLQESNDVCFWFIYSALVVVLLVALFYCVAKPCYKHSHSHLKDMENN